MIILIDFQGSDFDLLKNLENLVPFTKFFYILNGRCRNPIKFAINLILHQKKPLQKTTKYHPH